MPNFFENIIARGLAGGLQGSLEQFLAEEAAKKRAIALAWGKGEGAIPTEALPSFLRAGWGVGGPSPDIPTQLSPLSKSGVADYRPGPMQRGYASIESPGVRAEREFGQGVEAKFSDPASKMYLYLQNSGRSAAEARQMTLSVFGENLPEGHWLFEVPTAKEMLGEEKAKTELGQKMGMEKILPGIIGAYGKEGFAKEMEPRLGRPLLENMGIVPPVEKVEAPRALTDSEKLAHYRIKIKKGMATEAEKNFVEQKGYDPDTGEKVEKEKVAGIYSPEIEKKRKEADSVLKDLDDKEGAGEDLSPGEQVLREATQAYLDSTMSKYATAGFVGEKAKPPESFYKWIESVGLDKVEWDKVKSKHPDWDLSEFGQ